MKLRPLHPHESGILFRLRCKHTGCYHDATVTDIDAPTTEHAHYCNEHTPEVTK